MIIERMRLALTHDHRRDPPGFLDLILGRHPVERDALLLQTICGQAALALNPAGQLIVRSRGNPSLTRYLIKALDGVGEWDGRQRGWRVPGEEAVNALARIVGDRMPIREKAGPAHHPASIPKTIPVVLHCAFGIATGERVADSITLRVLEARLRAAVRDRRPCGEYEDGRDVGRWIMATEEFEMARIWADALR